MAAPLDLILAALQGASDTASSVSPRDPSALRNFWSLTEQAGPLRWPIFGVFGIGLTLVISKFYELVRDGAHSRTLLATDYRSRTLKDITALVAAESESMLALLQSTMLNVFQTRPSEGLLHDEIANFVSFQQDQFGVFRRRMEFLSDTAGALGLLGTVWGMFEVFFQGTSDKDVILRGMGIALITTLLGLVVSIVLNLSATELSTVFDKRLERISKKSDELRFRLLELAVAPAAPPALPGPAARPSLPDSRAGGRHVSRPPDPDPPAKRPASSGAAPDRDAVDNRWIYLEAEPAGHTVAAGETVRNLELRARRNGGQPVGGTAVLVTIPPDAGALAGGGRELRRETDGSGILRFEWQAPTRAGSYYLTATVPGHPGLERRIELTVVPGAPHRCEREGNNQAAVAGMKLAQPLGVRVHDRFGNAVAGVPVLFKVESGHGRFGQHGTECRVTTDAAGAARAPFAVSSEAGPNAVVASVEGHTTPLEFIAFGTEL